MMIMTIAVCFLGASKKTFIVPCKIMCSNLSGIPQLLSHSKPFVDLLTVVCYFRESHDVAFFVLKEFVGDQGIIWITLALYMNTVCRYYLL